MNESLLVSVTADVMYYDGSQWVRPDSINSLQNFPDSHHLSNIQLMRSNADFVFRIVAIRTRDNKRLVNQQIFHRLKYKEATPSFHQWRNEHKQVIGLNFTNEQDAKIFYEAVKQVLDKMAQLVSPSLTHSLNSNGTSIQSHNQQQQKAPLGSAPPPPPPPPPDLKSLLSGKQQPSFADKLKGVKLRKSSTGNGVQRRTVSPSNSVGSSNGSGSVSSKFQSQDLMSELSDRLSKRKMTVEASTSVNDTQNRVSTQQTLPMNNAKGPADVPYGRIPSASSLSSQDDANAGTGTAVTLCAIPPMNNNTMNGQTSTLSNDNANSITGQPKAPITCAAPSNDNTNSEMLHPKAQIICNDLERMKRELMEQFCIELQSLKRELTQTIRDEMAKLSGDRR